MGAVKDEIYKCETCGNVFLVLEGGDGESRWEKGGTLFFKPFTAAEVRYFDKGEVETARKWTRRDES